MIRLGKALNCLSKDGVTAWPKTNECQPQLVADDSALTVVWFCFVQSPRMVISALKQR